MELLKGYEENIDDCIENESQIGQIQIEKGKHNQRKTEKLLYIAAKHLRAFCVNSILTIGVKTIWQHSRYAMKGAWFSFPVFPQIIKKCWHDVGTV